MMPDESGPKPPTLTVDEQGVTWAGNVPIKPPPGAVQHYRTTHGLGWLDAYGQWHTVRVKTNELGGVNREP